MEKKNEKMKNSIISVRGEFRSVFFFFNHDPVRCSRNIYKYHLRDFRHISLKKKKNRVGEKISR